ncbi:MAG: glycosyltransferase [Candidatus Eisenbacteria bacterium]|nr:glycosyltransferase [Candidatus Eisenbacteria bacterium]
MRAVLVNSMRGMGGGERWVLEVAGGLSERGHDVSVAGRRGGRLAREAREMGIPTIEVPMSGDADVVSVARLAVWIRRTAADVVNVQIKRAVRLGAAAAAFGGRPAVVERRGLELPVEPSTLDRLVYARFVDHVIVNAEAIGRGLLEAELVPPDRLSVIPNGIDPARVEGGDGPGFRGRFGIGAEASLVLFAGRLVGDKRPFDALDAFARVARRRSDVRLVIVGDGPLEEPMRARVDRELEGRVTFCGRLDGLRDALAAADVLIVSSRREGMPHVVLEAMAAGTPVVATAVSGIPEIIEDGETGVLSPPGDVAALSSRLLDLLDDEGRRVGLARSARRVVESRHRLDRMLDEVEERFATEAARVRAGRDR